MIVTQEARNNVIMALVCRYSGLSLFEALYVPLGENM
jgi:hypothetical protein